MTHTVTAAVAHPYEPGPAARVTPTSIGSIEYTDEGEGPVVMTLHGGMGGHDQSRLLALALLGDHPAYRVLAVSRPGYLGTPLTSGSTPDEQADLFAALLDSLGIKRAIIAAVSAGGPPAIAFAARHPDRCAALILVSTASGTFAVPDFAIRRLRQFQKLVRLPGVARLLGWLGNRQPEKAAARSIRDAEVLKQTLAHSEAGPLLLALQGSIFDRLAQRLPGTLSDTLAFADLLPLPLGSVVSPTLVIHGTSDAVVPFAHGERSAREIGGAELFAVPDGEHVALFTHLDEVRQRVSVFLSRYPA